MKFLIEIPTEEAPAAELKEAILQSLVNQGCLELPNGDRFYLNGPLQVDALEEGIEITATYESDHNFDVEAVFAAQVNAAYEASGATVNFQRLDGADRNRWERIVSAVNASAEKCSLAEMAARKDAAYLERNRVVAALAKVFPSGIARTAIDGWGEDWHGCVYIDLPTGQVSWHFHDSQADLFQGLPPYLGTWDGHDTPEKYRRLAQLGPSVLDIEHQIHPDTPIGSVTTGEWDAAQTICDAPEVDSAIRNLLEDQTGDNATCVVRAVLRAAKPAPTVALPAVEPS